ncbi:MAG: TonB-dependent receptor [Bacteroidaceae bacterium]|nr:TonB-dependent receptor [Bacteroidaceae bacterium]
MEKRLSMLLASLFLCVGMAMAQVTVKGTIITADDGEPLPGASVKILGQKTGTTTDINGAFTITVPDANTRLELSHIGMLPRVVKARNGMQIALDTDDKLLEEVLVVGYGTSTRSAFTGSAVEIKSDDITSHVSASATSALVGKVAGITATSSDGAPGSAPTIRIRGIGSYAASTTPLYVIDGVPMSQALSTINPNDIESISVLKDASATAIYGNRGANGVVIITTKKSKGVAKDAEVTFDARVGSNSRLIPRYDLITDPGQYYETQYRALYNSVAYNGGTSADAYAFADATLYGDVNNGGLGYQVYTLPAGEKLIGTNFRLNPNAKLGYSDGQYYYTPDNWYDEVYHSSTRQEYNASVSGNSGRMSYFASAGYLNDGGQVDNSQFERYTARTNLEYQAKKWLKLTTNMAFTHYDNQRPSYSDTYGSSTNVFYTINGIAPIFPLYVRDAQGNIMTEQGRTVYDANQTNFRRPSFGGNSVRDNVNNRRRTYDDIFFGQWGVTVTPIEGLDIKANLSATSDNARSTSLSSRFGSASSVDGAASVSSSRYFSVNQQYMVNYFHTFNEVHNLGIVAGYEQLKDKDQGLSAYNTHLYNPYIGEINNAVGPNDDMSMTSSTDNYMTEGYLARATYDYAERFFANASIRRDASSKFAPGHRWGTFWSAGFAWQVNKEEFMKDISWVDLLKLKISYGENGNDGGMGWHAYADRYATSFNSTTKTYNVTMSDKGNEDLTWETKKMWNFGVDFSFFNYRLNGTFEVYTGTTSDLLWWKQVPLSSGLTVTSFPANVGKLLNRGVELSLNGDVIRTKNIKWNLNMNLAHNHNEFTELDASITEKGLRSSNQIVRLGGSRYHAYMKKFAGVDQTNGRAQYWKAYTYADQDKKDPNDLTLMSNTYGEGPIVKEELTYDLTEASLYDCGDVLPKLQGGFGTTFEAYGFDLSAQFSYQLGGKTYDGGYQQLMHNGSGQQLGTAMHKDLLKAWSPENPNSDIPRLSTSANDDPGSGSQTPIDRFLTSSNYLCLNNLTVGYTFPREWTRKLQIQNLRVYFAGENLFLLTARKGLDPRFNLGIGSFTAGQGLASGSYSAMRTFTGGLTVTF